MSPIHSLIEAAQTSCKHRMAGALSRCLGSTPRSWQTGIVRNPPTFEHHVRTDELTVTALDVCHAEGQIPIQYGHDAVEVPGARALLDRLNQATIPWAIVTSGTTPLFSGWLKVLQLARPKTLVSAEHVEKGKPDPACYKLGAKQLGLADVDPSQILVLEDAPAGVRAGKAAGYRVVALATTHRIDQLWEAGADWVVRDMRSVTVASWDAKAQRARIEFRDALLK